MFKDDINYGYIGKYRYNADDDKSFNFITDDFKQYADKVASDMGYTRQKKRTKREFYFKVRGGKLYVRS